MISATAIKELREATGVSVMLCRRALLEADGDLERARAILARASREVAAKKADRALAAGTIAAYLHHGGTVGTMVELSSETDFVSGNAEFKTLAHDIAMQVAALNPETVDELLASPFIKEPSQTIQALIENATTKFGEKIAVARFARFGVGSKG